MAETSSSIGINENNISVSGNVYPNPNSGIFTLNNNESNSTIEIFDTQGQLVFTQQLVFSYHDFNISTFAAGVYTILITSGNKAERKKLVKE